MKRSLAPGFKSDVVVILRGDQGWGKSAFARSLLPPERDDWFSDGVDLDASDQERVESTDATVVCEWSEFNISGRRLAAAKRYLSRTNDNSIRRAFARSAEDSPRRFVFVGTTDSETPLPNDPAGNRRFLVVDLAHGANVEEWADEHRDQLWAEALKKVLEGYNPTLPRSLLDEQERANQAYRSADEELEGLIEELEELEAAKDAPQTLWSAAALKSGIDRQGVNGNALATALINRGWTRCRIGHQGSRGWEMPLGNAMDLEVGE